MKTKFPALFVLLSVLFSFSVYAQEDESDEDVPVSSEKTASENEDASAGDPKNDAGAAETKVSAKKDKMRTDPYLKMDYYPVKKLTLKSDKVRISLMKNTYSFNIYAVDEAGNAVPVLSSYDDSSSSFISAMIGKSEYRLNREAGVTAEVRQMDKRCQIAYRIPETVQVTVDFMPLASVKGQENDMVKVTVYTTNISKKNIDISLKALLDTILGENTECHFITGSKLKVSKEVMFETMREEKWLLTSNGKTSAQFIFAGKGISDPVQVTLANKDLLSASSAWRPKVSFDRSFSSVTAYNNSAINVNWAPVKLAPEETKENTFYIAVGTDKNEPKGEAFLKSLGFEDVVVENEEKDDENIPPEVEKFDEIVVPDEDKPLKRTEITVESPAKQTGVDFIVPPVTDKQLDLEYIQNLIDRINSLNSDPNLVDRSEVRRLNAELDAILEKIRQKK